MATADFPTTIQKIPPIGVAGDPATTTIGVETDRNYYAGDDSLVVGCFAWHDPANEIEDDWGSGIFAAVSTTSSSDPVAPLGLIGRNLSNVNYDIRDGGTLEIPRHTRLIIWVQKDLYVTAPAAVTRGQVLFANVTDGSLLVGDVGGTVANGIETGWVIKDTAPAGALICVSKWN